MGSTQTRRESLVVLALACSCVAGAAYPQEAVSVASLKAAAEKTLEDWVSLLSSEDSAIRQPAQQRVIDAGAAAVPAVLAALETASTGRYERELAWALYMIGPPARDAAPALARLLAKRPPEDRVEIALALANVDPERGKAAVPELGRCALDGSLDGWQRSMCARELGQLDAAAGAPALVSALADKDPEVRASAARALQTAPADKSRGALTARLGDPALAVRLRAASSLLLGVPNPPPEALKTLLAGLCGGTSDDSDVVASALDEAPPEATAGAADALVPRLGAGDPKCRTWAAVALGRVDGRRALPSLGLLRQALKSEDRMLRQSAGWTVRRMGAPAMEALPDLERAAQLDPILEMAVNGLREGPPGPGACRIQEVRLVGAGKRDGASVGYLLHPNGKLWEVQKGQQFFDGEVESVGLDGLDFRIDSRADGSPAPPSPRRVRLFEKEPAPLALGPDFDGVPLSLNFDGDVTSLAKLAGDFSGGTVIVEAGTRGPVRIAARNAPWDGLLQRALEAGGFASKLDRGSLRIGSRDRIQKLRPLSSRKYTGHTISLSFSGGDMADIARLFADVSGLLVDIPPGPYPPVTISTRDIPWDQAFELIVASQGWTMTIDATKVRADP